MTFTTFFDKIKQFDYCDVEWDGTAVYHSIFDSHATEDGFIEIYLYKDEAAADDGLDFDLISESEFWFAVNLDSEDALEIRDTVYNIKYKFY